MISAPILSLPKTDLHLHLDGAVRPQTLLDLARQRKMDPARLQTVFQSPPDGDLAAYLERFDLVLPLLQTRQALSRAGRELVEDCAAHKASYVEIRFCPLLHVEEGLRGQAVVEAVLEGVLGAQEATGTQARVILCTLHGMTESQADQVANLAIAYRGKGVVALDLAGDEGRGFDLAPFTKAFWKAKDAGLHITVHAGEAGPGENVTEAITVLGAQRIGHGTRIFTDPRAVELALENRVGIEVCLKSNVQTGAVGKLADHPLRRMLAVGLCATICTDNTTVSHTTLDAEWRLLTEELGFNDDELMQLLANGFAQMFLDDAITPFSSTGA